MGKYLEVGALFPNGIGFSPRHTSEQVRVGTHAIDSHDELVQMNKELLAALEIARECLNHPGGTSGGLWIEANEKAISAISKAKGGKA